MVRRVLWAHVQTTGTLPQFCCYSQVFVNPVFSPLANILDSDTVAKWGRDG